MPVWPKHGSGRQWVRDFFRRYWQQALIWRDRRKLSEEAFHLVLAGGVGLVGGLSYVAFDQLNQGIQWLILGQTGDILAIAEDLGRWQLLVIPTAGGLVAGLVLFLGLRLIGTPGLSNLLEVKLMAEMLGAWKKSVGAMSTRWIRPISNLLPMK